MEVAASTITTLQPGCSRVCLPHHRHTPLGLLLQPPQHRGPWHHHTTVRPMEAARVLSPHRAASPRLADSTAPDSSRIGAGVASESPRQWLRPAPVLARPALHDMLVLTLWVWMGRLVLATTSPSPSARRLRQGRNSRQQLPSSKQKSRHCGPSLRQSQLRMQLSMCQSQWHRHTPHPRHRNPNQRLLLPPRPRGQPTAPAPARSTAPAPAPACERARPQVPHPPHRSRAVQGRWRQRTMIMKRG